MGTFADVPTQSGHPTPNIARCGMGAKTPFSFKKGVEILNLSGGVGPIAAQMWLPSWGSQQPPSGAWGSHTKCPHNNQSMGWHPQWLAWWCRLQCPAGAGARQAGGGPRVPRGVARLGVGLSRVYTWYIPGIPKYRYIPGISNTRKPNTGYMCSHTATFGHVAAWAHVFACVFTFSMCWL